jgi:hypothetical protein
MDICHHLQALEEQLIYPATRKSAAEIVKLLADEFIEFGSSGRIFNKQQVIESLKTESQDHRSLTDFKAVQLAPDVVLVTYQAIQHKTPKEKSITSLRSSTWKLIDNRWQMVFHQGTIASTTMTTQ